MVLDCLSSAEFAFSACFVKPCCSLCLWEISVNTFFFSSSSLPPRCDDDPMPNDKERFAR